jgi:hypothetical protein
VITLPTESSDRVNTVGTSVVQYSTVLVIRHIWDQGTAGLLEKVGTNLSCTAQHRSLRIDYHLTELLSFIYFTYINVYCEFFVH